MVLGRVLVVLGRVLVVLEVLVELLETQNPFSKTFFATQSPFSKTFFQMLEALIAYEVCSYKGWWGGGGRTVQSRHCQEKQSRETRILKTKET